MNSVVDTTAYLLISHGSRDPRPHEAMTRLADLVRKHLEQKHLGHSWAEAEWTETECAEKGCAENRCLEETAQNDEAHSLPAQQTQGTETPVETSADGHTALLTRRKVQTTPAAAATAQVMVGTACLELAPLPLCEQICEFGLRVAAAGARELKLLPIFLMPGVHVKEDIPQEVEAARSQLTSADLQLTLCPHLGSHEKIGEVLASRLAAAPAEGSLLIAHGSRRPKGNKIIKGLADRLNTTVAYWSTPPDIETQVIDLMQQGVQRLTILPYFLFPGGITDAITHRTEELAERFPKISFRLLPTLGANDEVADLAIELTHQR